MLIVIVDFGFALWLNKKQNIKIKKKKKNFDGIKKLFKDISHLTLIVLLSFRLT